MIVSVIICFSDFQDAKLRIFRDNLLTRHVYRPHRCAVAVLPRMKNENRLHAEGNICRHSLIVLTQKSNGKNAHLQGKRQGGMEYLCVL